MNFHTTNIPIVDTSTKRFPVWYDDLNQHEQCHYEQQLFQNALDSQEFLQSIKKNLPPVFTRQIASKVIGGLMSPKTLSNLDALGQGPPVKVKLGSKVGYERDSFVQWLRCRMTT